MDWRTIDGYFSEKDQALNLRLAEEVQDGIVVSIGVHKGRAMAALAEAFRQAGNLSAMTLVGVDYFYKGTFPVAAENLSDIPRIRLVKGNTIDAAADFADGSVAAVFIDHGLDYETYAATISAWQPKLREGGIICGHDYQANWPGVVQAVDEAFPQGVETFHTCWLPLPATGTEAETEE
jgi:predicted O-methyltransferase YrrM